ncbi:leucine-rich repeat protein 1-like isoform X1 [Rhodnius prolixus]|uniref:leucine-rich repeat protein 1-like isoform X1 n=1 Tax=Rhodnius prolixus TaxID=13249 RepID=UPI003D18AF50
MKLTGDIQVYDRLLPSYNIPNKRSEWSHLSIGFYGERDKIYLLHQTQRNSVGVKYEIEKLIAVFTKYISQGKMTLRFNTPSHDLIIHSNEDHLRNFIKFLQKVMKVKGTNEIKTLKLLDLSKAPSKVGPKPKTKLLIKCKKDLQAADSFPRTLEVLQMNNTGLTRLDGKIFRLQKLKVLNLENNCLETIPDQISLLPCLRELHLAGNFFGRSSLKFWLFVDNLQAELVYLDLSRNELKTLPSDIYKLQKLKYLYLDDNFLQRLPSSFGRLPALKELKLCNNSLTALPASFRFLFLDILDVSRNPVGLKDPCRSINLIGEAVDRCHSVKNETEASSFCLLDLSAKEVLKNRLNYDRRSLPLELITYLDSACYCVCGNATFPSNPEEVIKFNFKRNCIQITYGFDENSLPIEVRFCSTGCRSNYYKRNI